MSEVFLSYSRADRPIALALAAQLSQLGVDVWWDHELLGGDNFRKRITEVLTRANVVIVIWSRTAIESEWVINEAATARAKKTLLPTTIDGQDPPIDFRSFHTIDLRSWLPGEPLPEALVKALEERLGRALATSVSSARSGALGRMARRSTQAWYFDFESTLFYFIGQGIVCTLINISLVMLLTTNTTTTAPALAFPSWSPYLFALLNGIIAAALYMRPALETMRLRVAIPLFAIAALLSLPAYYTAHLLTGLAERQLLILIGPLMTALLMVTALAQRASARST